MNIELNFIISVSHSHTILSITDIIWFTISPGDVCYLRKIIQRIIYVYVIRINNNLRAQNIFNAGEGRLKKCK